MVEFLSSWAGQIAISVVIVTILEGILPDGKNKKYIKVVTGMYLLFVILSPIITKISGQEIDIEKILADSKLWEENTTEEVINLDTSSSIKNMYLSNLKLDITNKLKERGYKVLNAEFDVELEDEENYGKIYKMNLNLKKSDNVEKIEINVGNKIEEKEKLENSEIKELKEYLSNIYDMQKENIIIN